jgi:hypothetical protein
MLGPLRGDGGPASSPHAPADIVVPARHAESAPARHAESAPARHAESAPARHAESAPVHIGATTETPANSQPKPPQIPCRTSYDSSPRSTFGGVSIAASVGTSIGRTRGAAFAGARRPVPIG